MELNDFLFFVNPELKSILLAFYLDESPKTAQKISEELEHILDEDLVPHSTTIYGHLISFADNRLITASGNPEDSRGSKAVWFSNPDSVIRDLARFTLLFSYSADLSMRSMIGKRSGQKGTQSDSYSNRISILNYLYTFGDNRQADIAAHLSMNDSRVMGHLQELDKSGLVQKPAIARYDVVKSLDEYFLENLPKAMAYLITHPRLMAFTMDTLQSQMQAEGISISRRRIQATIKRLKELGAIEELPGKPYHPKRRQLIKAFPQFLTKAQRAFYQLSKKGLSPGGEYEHFGLKEMCNLTRLPMGELDSVFYKLVESGYFHADESANKAKLTGKGIEFVVNYLPRVSECLGTGATDTIADSLSPINNQTTQKRRRFINSMMRLYKEAA